MEASLKRLVKDVNACAISIMMNAFRIDAEWNIAAYRNNFSGNNLKSKNPLSDPRSNI